MSELKTSPKLQELCRWDQIDEVNRRLDRGDTPNSVWMFIKSSGLNISRPLIYDYAKMRKKALIEGINVEHMIGSVTKPILDKYDPATKSTSQKLKSEIDALDMIIQGGFNTLKEWNDRPIAPKTMMDAIKLKAELTDRNHGFLTNYGIEDLKRVEQLKYQLLMEHLISYIPDDKKQEAIDRLEVLEDEYYQTTDFYEEYVNTLDLSDTEKQKKIDDYFNRCNKEENNIISE